MEALSLFGVNAFSISNHVLTKYLLVNNTISGWLFRHTYHLLSFSEFGDTSPVGAQYNAPIGTVATLKNK